MAKELQEYRWQRNATLWAFGLSIAIIIITGVLARVTLNIAASTIENPDLAVVILLEDEGVTDSVLLREESSTRRHYLLETKAGNKLVILEKKDAWEVAEVEDLHE